MKAGITTQWLLSALLWALMAGHTPTWPDQEGAELQGGSSSCESGQACILLRDWVRPWVAELQHRTLRHIESEERTSGSSPVVRRIHDTGDYYPARASHPSRHISLAEEILTLLYPFHELG